MKRPALGHLLGYTALTIILTAGAAQSLAGSNTVFSDDIVDGTITTSDLAPSSVFGSNVANDSLTGADIANGTLTGTDVDESTLVPTCPGTLTRRGDACYTSTRTAATFNDALADCKDETLRLPSYSEATLVASGSNGIWTDIVYVLAIGEADAYFAMTVSITGSAAAAVNDLHPYRCVTGARP